MNTFQYQINGNLEKKNVTIKNTLPFYLQLKVKMLDQNFTCLEHNTNI